MTKARLTTWIDWDPDKTGIGADLPGPNAIEMDIVVKDGEDPITIVVTDDKVSTSVQTEPKLVTVPVETDLSHLIVDLQHVHNALTNGSFMTRANISFGRVCAALGFDRDLLDGQEEQ